MKENILVDLSRQFAVDIIHACDNIEKTMQSKVLLQQMLRSGTSIGANIHEANYGASKADFINKLQIALKECYETEYWLKLLSDTSYLKDKEYHFFYSKCSKIRKILTASINTAKETP